jgi:hypothetical protein
VSNNKKMFLAGLPWSALVIATLWAGDPAACPITVIGAMLLVLNWMVVISLFSGSRTDSLERCR